MERSAPRRRRAPELTARAVRAQPGIPSTRRAEGATYRRMLMGRPTWPWAYCDADNVVRAEQRRAGRRDVDYLRPYQAQVHICPSLGQRSTPSEHVSLGTRFLGNDAPQARREGVGPQWLEDGCADWPVSWRSRTARRAGRRDV